MQDNSKVCIGYAVGVYNLMPGFVINKQAYFIGVEKEITAYFFYIYDRKHLPGGIPLPRELFIKERTPVFHSKRRLHHLQLGQQPYKTCGYRGFREI